MPTHTRLWANPLRTFPRCFLLTLLLVIISWPAGMIGAQAAQEDRKAKAQRLVNEAGELAGKGTQQSAEAAADKYKEAVSLFDSVKDFAGEVLALNNLGLLYKRTGESQKALDAYTRALKLARDARDQLGEAHTLYNLGAYYSPESGSTHKAIDYAKQSVPLFVASRDFEYTFDALLAVAELHRFLEDKSQAIEYFKGILPLLDKSDDRAAQALAHYYLGVNYRLLTDYEMALDHGLQALPLFRAASHRVGEVNTLNIIGLLYGSLGEHDTAAGYFNQVLSAGKQYAMPGIESMALGNLGLLEMSSGDAKKALDYHLRSLAGKEDNDREGRCATLSNIADGYSLLKDWGNAFNYYTQALTVAREVQKRGLQALALNGLGWVYLKTGKKQEARSHYNQALALSREISSEREESSALNLLAALERDEGNYQQALKLAESSLRISDNSRGRIFNQDLRTTYSSYRQTEYEFYVSLLMDMHRQSPSAGYDVKALEANERRQARTLIELLTAANLDIRQGVSPELLESERSLRRQLNAIAAQLQSPGEQLTEEAAKNLGREIETLNTKLQRVEGLITRSGLRNAELMRPRSLTLREIQTQVLDSDTLLLEYSLGDDKSYLWAITTTAIKSYELPGREELRKVAREFHETLASYVPPHSGTTPKKRDIGDQLRRQSAARAAGQLSKMLLGPVAPLLGNKRLLIVADGPLLYVPFAALPIPIDGAGAPLVTEHEIINSPSSSTLAALRREAGSRRPATKTLAVLADPVFERGDERLKTPGGGAAVKAGGLACAGENRQLGQLVHAAAKRAGVLRDGGCIGRLPGTQREAEALVRLVPPTQAHVALGFDASRATATSAELTRYRYVHFATHGFISDKRPAELSGIVLSLFDEKGAPQDGFLRVRDIYTMKLAADMVVLSACESGLGKELGGEGLIGLTRGFMYAGAPRVVASLWDVNDDETAELMSRFYRGILVDKLRPSKALQAAQVSMLKDRRFAGSSNWAAFVMQGEWR